jgi:hypothetical protein
MPRRLVPIIALLALFAAGDVQAAAKSCKDAQGKAIKCPAQTVMSAENRCINAKTNKFVKCNTPGAQPVPQN